MERIELHSTVNCPLIEDFYPNGKDSMDFEPKLFDGEHYFIIIEKPDGGSHLVQGENFSGILTLLLWGNMELDTKNGFEEMNKTIKILSETIR